MVQEYGGYIEFEHYNGSIYHDEAIALNCGRNALAYLCKAKHIQKLYIPYFLCESVANLCNKINVAYEGYHIGSNFEPIFDRKIESNEYLYLVNYYGQLSNEKIACWKAKYKNLIVDNAQSYFQLPLKDTDTLYTCRKYFGVADGAFLYTDSRIDSELPIDESFDRMRFLLGRLECGANKFYSEYVANNKLFATEPMKKMSKLTQNILRGIDYHEIARQRQRNFMYLESRLRKYNELSLCPPYGAFMYPLLVKDGTAKRKLLQQNRIYVPTLWPNVLASCESTSLEYRYAADLLPLPIDQRYKLKDMEQIARCVESILAS